MKLGLNRVTVCLYILHRISGNRLSENRYQISKVELVYTNIVCQTWPTLLIPIIIILYFYIMKYFYIDAKNISLDDRVTVIVLHHTTWPYFYLNCLKVFWWSLYIYAMSRKSPFHKSEKMKLTSIFSLFSVSPVFCKGITDSESSSDLKFF